MLPFTWPRSPAVACTMAGLVLSACSLNVPSSAPILSTPVSPPSAAPSTPAPPPAPVVPDSPATAPPPCAEEERAVDRVVGRQLEAFSRDDYRAAFALASRSFRTSTDLPGFRAIITTDYPQVANSVSHALIECRRIAPGAVAAIVSVTGADNVTVDLAYRFVREEGQWRIDGATTVRRVTSPTV